MKIVKTVVSSSLFFGMAISAAQAEICWRLSPFIDTVRVVETTVSDEAIGGTHSLVVGNWTAGNVYSLPIVGSIDVDVPNSTPPKFRFGAHGTNHTALFANHSDCTLDASLGGGFKISCDGNVAGIFNATGASFAVVSCDTLSTTATPVGRAAGE